MPDPQLLMSTLAEFTRILTGQYEVTDVLYDLSEQITEVLGITGAGVALLQEGRLRFIVAAHEAVTAIEEVQEEHQAGPCVTALKTAKMVTISDIRTDPMAGTWHPYTEHALSRGIVAVAGVPLLIGDEAFGSLNLYNAEPHDWTDDDLFSARVLADIATGYVRHASELQQQRRLAEQLQRALNSRIVIEQAKGVTAHTHGIHPDDAFVIIRRHARNNGARLYDVANAVVNGRLAL